MDISKILIYILNIIIIFITIYLIFLLVRSKSFKIYPCYNITVISFIVLIDNILRLHKLEKYSQAFLLTFLDKALLATITSQAIITYLGVCWTNMYFQGTNEKKIFIGTSFIGLSISAILSLIYIKLAGTSEYDNYYYCKDDVDDKKIKRIGDSIFNSIFLLVNFCCCLFLLIYLTKKKNEASLGIIEDLDYKHHHTKIVLMLIFNSAIFIESYLIVFDKFPNYDYVDLVYLITCLIILLYYTINKIIIKETMRILCRKSYDKKYPSLKKNGSLTDEDDDDDAEKGTPKRDESFSDD